MKLAIGSSAIFYIFVAISFAAILLLAPYPHFSLETQNWYLGASVGSRILGNVDENGVALDTVAVKVSRASLTSPLSIECTTDENCKEYPVSNQCMSYCGNMSETNKDAIAILNRNRVCDPAGWRGTALSCRCLAGRCISLN